MNFRIGWKVHLMNRIAVFPAGCRDNLNRPAVNITGRTLRITRHVVPSCNFRRSTGFLWRFCLDDEGYIEAF